ncbi:hypothetical protein GNF78_00505 [Clostridium perfringens]|uniref:hypothetical protein n=2 Tax=Clostridium perfringens TaxID=1502 RepID=UPI0028633A7F|nr:hypothetical protein [Clostridium perfringens]EIL8446428.1 hypothetical protein [Clostridium perfringens]ELC8379965.1 hypothetical protein [Clostridium perfringens]MDY3359029.1 hypothetical protein [Clostridium celatum]MDZ5035681.1 hypothetical protein [Clostridium perfringens]
MKKKLFLLTILSILIIIITSIYTFSTKSNKAEGKESFNLSQEIDNSLNVIKLISKDCLLVFENNKVIEYFPQKNKFGETIFEVSNNNILISLETTQTGLVWLEFNNSSEEYSLNYKEFNEDSKTEIDKFKSEFSPELSLSKNHIIYQTTYENILKIQLVNLLDFSNEIIFESPLNEDNISNYFSKPDIDGNYVVWSKKYLDNNNLFNSSIYLYNIELSKLELIEENSLFYDPILYNDSLICIKYNLESEMMPDENNNSNLITYSEDYIVYYDSSTKEWKNICDDENIIRDKETIFNIVKKDNFLYWTSSFSNKGFIYDISLNTFKQLPQISDLPNYNYIILDIKDNTVLYKLMYPDGTTNLYLYTLI